jgi:hypothetical protein
MRARVAYISSLGTTAILVAAALLMLAVVSALVAFKGWPGAANAEDVRSVPLEPSFTRASATLVVARPSHGGSGVVRASTVAARRATGRLSTVGLVKQVGPTPVAGVVKVTSGPGPSMHGVFPQPGRPIPSFPAPAGRNPVTVPLPSTSAGGGSNTPVQIQLPAPSVATGPVAETGSAVGQVVSHVPSPAAVVEQVRGALPTP